jgi:acyl-CoA synthetase (AMP-forming)/AMP-acid ligase II
MRFEEYLRQGARHFGARTALICMRTRVSYADLDAKSDRLALVLRDRGIGRGDRIILFMDPRWEGVVALFAALKAGAAVVTADADMTPEELRRLVDHEQAAAVVTQAQCASAAGVALAHVFSVRMVILVGGDRRVHSGGCVSFEEAVSGIGRCEFGGFAGGTDDALAVLTDGSILTHRDITESPDPDESLEGAVELSSLAERSGLWRLFAAVRSGAAITFSSHDGLGVYRRHLAPAMLSSFTAAARLA